MSGQTWLILGGSAVAGIGLGGFVMTRTSWWRVRMYALNVKRTFDRHDVQSKGEAVQALGSNPNPLAAKRPLRDLIAAYQGLVADLEKLKPPAAAQEIHESTLTMHREAMQLYQMAAAGGFRQKVLVDKQRKLQQMERVLTEKMEKLYGPIKQPAKGSFTERLVNMLKKRSAK